MKTTVRIERTLHVRLRRLVIETQLGRFLSVLFSLIYACCSDYFMCFMHPFIECIIERSMHIYIYMMNTTQPAT